MHTLSVDMSILHRHILINRIVRFILLLSNYHNRHFHSTIDIVACILYLIHLNPYGTFRYYVVLRCAKNTVLNLEFHKFLLRISWNDHFLFQYEVYFCFVCIYLLTYIDSIQCCRDGGKYCRRFK